MTIQQFAQSIVEDATYRETLRTRAQAGTLPENIELFLLEAADGRLPASNQQVRDELRDPTPQDLGRRASDIAAGRLRVVYSS